MAAEIREQPDAFRRILTIGRPRIEEAAARIREFAPRFVILAARGTSDHAALYAKYLIETRLALPAGLASPSATTVYNARPDMRDVLYIAASQSGTSPDVVEAMTAAGECGAMTVAVTNTPESDLARHAQIHLDILAGPERAVAATKTYTAELLSLYLLISFLASDDAPNLDALPDQAGNVLALEDSIERIAARYRFADQMVLTARGYNYPTAREGALKLMETSYIVADGFSGADLLHGPMAMIRRGFPVIAIAPPGPGSNALRPVLQRLEEQLADVWVIGDADVPGAAITLRLPIDVPEDLSPLLAIMPLQLFALHLARLRGINPDQPDGLEKVTRTW